MYLSFRLFTQNPVCASTGLAPVASPNVVFNCSSVLYGRYALLQRDQVMPQYSSGVSGAELQVESSTLHQCFFIVKLLLLLLFLELKTLSVVYSTDTESSES